MLYSRNNFISKFAKISDLTIKDATYVYDKFLMTILECLHEGNNVYLPGIGRFMVTRMKEKTLKHPRTGEPLVMPEYTKVKFHTAQELKDGMRDLWIE